MDEIQKHMAEEARSLFRQMRQNAETLTEALGLPQSAATTVMEILYKDDLPLLREVPPGSNTSTELTTQKKRRGKKKSSKDKSTREEAHPGDILAELLYGDHLTVLTGARSIDLARQVVEQAKAHNIFDIVKVIELSHVAEASMVIYRIAQTFGLEEREGRELARFLKLQGEDILLVIHTKSNYLRVIIPQLMELLQGSWWIRMGVIVISHESGIIGDDEIGYPGVSSYRTSFSSENEEG